MITNYDKILSDGYFEHILPVNYSWEFYVSILMFFMQKMSALVWKSLHDSVKWDILVLWDTEFICG